MLVEPKVKYTVKKDKVDDRDYLYKPTQKELREHVDLRQYASRVESQGHLSSCTGNAVVGAYELLLNKTMPDKFIDLSRLFVYYNARLLEDNTNNDDGAYVRDAIKGLTKYGICSEKIWPYHIKDYATKPTDESYLDAKHRNIENYYRVLTMDSLLDALNNDKPVVFGMLVYKSFDDLYNYYDTVPMPKGEEEPVGAHAMCFVGYDLNKKLFIARNSFGMNWGVNGYCYIPFDYVGKEVLDLWVFDIKIS
jgi:C1A family cysteine protease